MEDFWASQSDSGACSSSAYGLARKAVYDLIGYCHIMAIDVLVTYQSSRLSLSTPPSQHFNVVLCSHTLNRLISSALNNNHCWIELTMREIVSLLLIMPWKLHKLTLNSLFAIGASSSWPMCEYHALLVTFLSHFFLMQHINPNRATKSALLSGRPFRASMVWIVVACRQPIQNAT